MAHTKSALKRIRQDKKRHDRNQAGKTRLRTLTKKFRASLAAPGAEDTSATMKAATRALDKAASKGIVHHKTASRKVSRLAKAAHRKLSGSAAGPASPAAS